MDSVIDWEAKWAHGVIGSPARSTNSARSTGVVVLTRVAVCVAGLAVLLAACGPATSETPSPSTSSAGPASTFTKWDASTWQPPVTVIPREMSEKEMLQARAAMLADALEVYELPAKTPLPKLMGWVLPEDSGYVHARCMTEAGVPMVGEPNGSSRYTGSDDSAWQKAKKTRLATVQCIARHSPDPRANPPRTKSTLEAMWYYYRDFGIPCLRERGFEPDNPLPELTAYVTSEGDWTFYPVEDDPDHMLSVEDFRTCPEVPWKVLLNP